jgi:nitrite reductase (NO-forming)
MSLLGSILKAALPMKYRGVFVSTVALGVLLGASIPTRAASDTFNLTAERKHVLIGAGMTYNAWTYNGTVPGPVLKVHQGDDVSISLMNHSGDAHGIDVHAAQISPERFSGDPMKSVGYSFKAEVPGVYAYHCSAIPILDHIGSGMYGMMVVEPKSGWPNGEADEVTLVESEFYGLPDQNNFIVGDHEKMIEGRPDFVVFNGAVDKYGLSNPIPIKVGELVRVFFVNAGPNLTSVFHVAGVLFIAVYRSGNPADALRGVNTLEVPPGDGAVFEFKVNQPGDYSFIDLNRAHQYKGAAGVFRATR